MIFVDTNVFLRFILDDHSAQSPRARKLIDRANRGIIKLWTTEWVIAEIYWVLSSKNYKLKDTSLFDILWTILSLKGLEIKTRN